MTASGDLRGSLASHRSPFSHEQTVARLRQAIDQRGLRLFAQIDHAAAARGAGLEMPPTVVLVFGDPATGTPLMLANPDFALELPSRLLVRQERDGSVFVLHHDAVSLGERYGLRPELLGGLALLSSFVDAVLAGRS